MKRSRFSEAQIIGILKEHQASIGGRAVLESLVESGSTAETPSSAALQNCSADNGEVDRD